MMLCPGKNKCVLTQEIIPETRESVAKNMSDCKRKESENNFTLRFHGKGVKE